jgi:hypothetical protein
MLFACLVLFLFGSLALMLAREIRRAHWTMLETIFATAVLGHAVIIPIVLTIKSGDVSDERIIAAAALGLALAMGMAYGSFWVFRDMAELKENRSAVRLFYALLGFLFLPSLLVIPYNFIFGWPIWITLLRLHNAAERSRIGQTSPELGSRIHDAKDSQGNTQYYVEHPAENIHASGVTTPADRE